MAGKHKAREDYCLRHEIPFPHFNRLPGRPIKPSPLYDRLKAKGDVERHDHFSCRRKVVHDMVGNECRAVRTGVGIMDISAVAKVEVTGPGAEAFLDRMVANRLPQKVGGIALTHMLHRRGRIELETTFVQLGAGWCYLVFAAFFEQRLLDHLAQHQVGEDAQVILRSNDWAALTLNGPKSRAVLGACTDADLSNAGFRWLSAQETTVGGISFGRSGCLMRVNWAGNSTYCATPRWQFMTHIGRQTRGMGLPITGPSR